MDSLKEKEMKDDQCHVRWESRVSTSKDIVASDGCLDKVRIRSVTCARLTCT